MNNRFLLAEKLGTLAPEIPFYRIKFNLEAWTDDYFEKWSIPKPQSMNEAVPKRKAEFFAGRLAAKKLLQSVDAKETHVPSTENRHPQFPLGWKGSITHSQGEAICAITRKFGVESLGLDLEGFLSQKSLKPVGKAVLSPEEEKIIDAICSNRNLALSLLFSAKESIFKCLNPILQIYFGFDRAVLKEWDKHRKRLRFQLIDLAAEKIGTTEMTVFYQIEKDKVLSWCLCPSKDTA